MKFVVNKAFLFFTTLLLFFSCSKDQENFCKPKPLRSITFGFETSLVDWIAQGGGGERKDESDIYITSENSFEGNQSCRFTVSPQSIVAGGNRAELTFDQDAVHGDEITCEWNFFVPLDYQDVLLKDPEGRPNWQVMGQWHHQPVYCEGEDWDNYAHQGASPPVAVYYNYFTTNDPTYSDALKNPEINSVFGFDPTWDEVSTITISYGYKSIAISRIEKGEWYRLKFNIKWSESNQGFIQVWLNDIPLTDGRIYGWNMLNKASHYFKFGLYRNPAITSTNKVCPEAQAKFYEMAKMFTRKSFLAMSGLGDVVKPGEGGQSELSIINNERREGY